MFVKTVRAAHLKMGGLLLLILAAGAALLVWPQAAAGGVSRGLSICSGVIIPSLFPFLVLALCQPAVALIHYLYHYQGGRSIYRMRTLPQRGELGRRCLAAPAAALGRCVLAAVAVAVLCALYYLLFRKWVVLG